jgi:hypothetical protein
MHEDPESAKIQSAMWYRYEDLVNWGRLIPLKMDERNEMMIL